MSASYELLLATGPYHASSQCDVHARSHTQLRPTSHIHRYGSMYRPGQFMHRRPPTHADSPSSHDARSVSGGRTNSDSTSEQHERRAMARYQSAARTLIRVTVAISTNQGRSDMA